MKISLKNGIALSIIPQIILVKWLGSYPLFIEHNYSEGVYPYISKFFRVLFGWLPFSIGDLVYAVLLIIALRYLIVKRAYIWNNLKTFGRNVIVVLAIAYGTFHLLWGFNYYRQPIAERLQINDTTSITQQELVQFTSKLIDRTNEIHRTITTDTSEIVSFPYSKKEILEKTELGYQNLEAELSFLSYAYPSLKESIFSVPLTYMGYGGYINPFTNEAQVNSLLPSFRYPIVCGHEVGHQIGYAAENETNFIGYLVTSKNKDLYFKYSAYGMALGYCLSDIRRTDETLFKELYKNLNPGVKKNFREVADFWQAYENPTEPIFKSIFSTFLKANNQADGIKSYSKMVSLLVRYHEKNPW